MAMSGKNEKSSETRFALVTLELKRGCEVASHFVPQQLLAHKIIVEVGTTGPSSFWEIQLCRYLILGHFILPIVNELNFLLQ